MRLKSSIGIFKTNRRILFCVTRKKVVAGLAGLILVSTGGAYWKLSQPIPAYEVKRVIDGDTFETTEKQLIRLSHIDAPDLELCGGLDAKKELEELVLGKPVYLKVMYRDQYMRLLSLVYTPEGFVNEEMVKTGTAIYRLSGAKSRETEILGNAAKTAAQKGLGVYGTECTQQVNPDNPKCTIKGNVRVNGTGKIYSLPGCESYASTLIQLHYGDRWFCTEKEAQKAGFVKAGGCN